MYWKAWELAFRNFHEPAPGSGFVSQFIDAAFNQNIFQWDTCFMTMFCNYAHPLVPGIGSLDNFYAKQHEDGEICREIGRATGKDSMGEPRRAKRFFSRWGERRSQVLHGRPAPQPPPHLTLDALNHPILAWAELESSRNRRPPRLALVYEPLVHTTERCRIRAAGQRALYDGLGQHGQLAAVPYLKDGGTAVDTSAQMVALCREARRNRRLCKEGH